MNRRVFHVLLCAFGLAVSSQVSAIGLGELRGQAALGDRLKLRVDLLGVGKPLLDASCFRLIRPKGGDLPWLRQADLAVQQGSTPYLEITSNAPLREPVIQIAVAVGCGQDLNREYTLLASPRFAADPEQESDVPVVKLQKTQTAQRLKPSVGGRSKEAKATKALPREARVTPDSPMPSATNSALPGGDRLLLSSGVVAGDPALALTDVLAPLAPDSETLVAQREMLRLEFRMLMALQEQATNQLEAAEKLRAMESTLGELKAKADGLVQQTENVPSAGVPPGQVQPSPQSPQEDDSLFSDWVLYGLLLGVVLGGAGWLLWKRRRADDDGDYPLPHAGQVISGEYEGHAVVPRADEGEAEVDLPVDAAVGGPLPVDVELDGGARAIQDTPVGKAAAMAGAADSLLSISATTVDEHFEANPVMELADIMLSFGRVKGAAQALQEYIDNNPQEALQPWIRLMDVYRMAGMRDEFEAVSRNLNQNFNVEVQRWEAAQAVDLDLDSPVPEAEDSALRKPQGLEDMPRIMATVAALWQEGDVVGYLYQLLRDNRGGQRLGFALPVVEEILFLIELKETVNRMGPGEATV